MILEILLALCNQFNIPSWAASELQQAHDQLATISDRDSIRYSVAQAAYHELLENHEDVAVLAMAYQNMAIATA